METNSLATNIRRTTIFKFCKGLQGKIEKKLTFHSQWIIEAFCNQRTTTTVQFRIPEEKLCMTLTIAASSQQNFTKDTFTVLTL